MKVGRPFVYGDRAIETILTLRELFRLTYRSTEGFTKGIVQLIQIQVLIPAQGQKCCTSLAKRAKTIAISLNGTLSRRKIDQVIPPQRNAKIKQHGKSPLPPLPRDEAIRGCRKLGRAEWKQQVGYHRRSLAETAMFRMQCLLERAIFGPTFKNRSDEAQKTEAKLRCKIMNHFTKIGLPKFVFQ